MQHCDEPKIIGEVLGGVDLDHSATARQILLAQSLITCTVALVALLFSFQAAYSALLGGLICLVPNVYFAHRVFRHRGALAARAIVRSFYVGEAIKLALTAVFFGLTFKFIKSLDVWMLFTGFVAAQVGNWLVPLLTKTGASN